MRLPLALVLLGAALACGGAAPEGIVVRFPGSALGAEAELLQSQLERFMALHPEIRVVQQRTPDAADQRHQLYVQWLNAWADDPDILQLDVIWTPEFAAAGWTLPLERFGPDTSDFFPATIAANTWRGELHAVPWFVDVGLLYWRSDLLDRAPRSLDELLDAATRERRVRHGWIWQGARYEGLVTVFVELLGAFGAAILDDAGRVVVDSPRAVHALEVLRDALDAGVVPRDALSWQEEQTRFAFQNGHALFMRNWPYAYPLMQQPGESAVAGRFRVSALPAAPGGRPSAALGGSQLAINARSDHPDAAWQVIAFLTHPDQMRERAERLGQYPPRRLLYAGDSLAGALAIPPAEARQVIEHAVARPATPVYTELSGVLQIWLHRALSGQESPEDALAGAAREIRKLLERSGLAAETREGTAP